MKLLLEYFGLIVFSFVVLVGGLILLPRVTPAPPVSPGEVVGLGLAFVVIGGGFAWYYLASSHLGTVSRQGDKSDQGTKAAGPPSRA